MKAALEHRRSQQHLELALTIAGGDWPPILKGKLPEQAFPCTTTTTEFGDLVDFVQHGRNSAYFEFLDSLSETEMVTATIAFHEASYQYLDRATRKLGHIVKQYV